MHIEKAIEAVEKLAKRNVYVKKEDLINILKILQEENIERPIRNR